MFKWIALGLGAYLLFGKKKLTEEEKVAAAAAAAKKDTEDAKKVYKDTDPTYLAWKAANAPRRNGITSKVSCGQSPEDTFRSYARRRCDVELPY